MASYADRFRRDANLAGRTEDDSLLFHFREGLQWRLKDEVHRARDRIHDLADIIECAKYWEDYYYTVRGDDAGDAGFGYIGGRNNNYNPLPRNDNRRPDYGRGTPADRPYQARGGQQTPFRSQDRNQGRNYQAERPNNFQPRPNGYQPAPYRPYGGGGGNTGPSGQNPRPYEGPKSNSNGYRPAGQNPGPAPQRQGTAPLSVEEITRQMERLQISLAQVAREQRRNEQRGVPMNIFTMEAEDPHPEPKDSQCSYDQGHPFAEEDTEDPYPGYVDVLVGTSGSEGFFVQALDPSDGVDLDSDPDTTTDGDISNLPLLCVMDPVSDAEDDYMWEEDDDAFMYDTLDHQQGMYNMAPAFYSTKRVADNLPPKRAPIKRVAFDPSTFGTSGAAPARNPATAPPRGNPLPQNPRAVPQNPRAVPVPQRNQGPPRPATPAARTNDPLQPPAPHRASGQGAGPSQPRAAAPDPARRADLVPDLPADALANSKGKEMALKAARSLTIDAAREANLIVPAAKICAAGHLLCDQNLVEKGKETARRADNFIRRQLSTVQPATATTAATAAHNNLCAADPSPGHKKRSQLYQEAAVAGTERLPELYQAASTPEDPLPSVTPIAAPRFALCQTPVTLSIPGQPTGMELDAIIDTGACECGLPLDTVRRLQAMYLIDTRHRQSYTTASGHKYKAMGKVNLTITLGPLSTVVTFNVTEALTYQILLGNDFLLAIGAIVDVRSRLLKFQVKPDIEATVPLTLYADENGVTNTMAMEGAKQDVNEAFWNTYAGMDPQDVLTQLVEDYAMPMLTMDVAEPPAEAPVTPAAVVSPPATAANQATYVLTTGATWVCWLTGKTYKEPADLYDQHLPLELPSVDLSRPINIPLDLPVHSNPWFEHMADELVPFACHHDPNSYPSLYCATPHTFQWVMILKAINFYGYDLFQAYPRFLPSFGRWLSLEPAQIGNMVQSWRTGATAVATAHLLALQREITTNDIIGMMCRYQITFGDLNMSLLIQGKMPQAFSTPAAVPAPCGYNPPVTAADTEPATTPAKDTPQTLPPLEDREQAYPSNAEVDNMPDLVSDSDRESEVDSMPDLVSESDTSSEVGSLPGLASESDTISLAGSNLESEAWDLPDLTDFDESESEEFEGMFPVDFSPPAPNGQWNDAVTTRGPSPTTLPSPQHLTCHANAIPVMCTMVPQPGSPFSDAEEGDIDETSSDFEDGFSSEDQDWDFLQRATEGNGGADKENQDPIGSLYPEPQGPSSLNNDGMQPRRKLLVAIEGNVGTKKNQLILQLQNDPPKGNWTIIPQPITKLDDESTLTDWFESLPKPSYSTQKAAAYSTLQSSFIHSHLETVPYPERTITQRSLWSTYHVYNKLNLPAARSKQAILRRLIEEDEVAIRNLTPDMIILVDTPPEVCYRRITTWGEPVEECIDRDFIYELDSLYEAALKDYPGRLVRIDGTLPTSSLAERVREAIESFLPVPTQQSTPVPPALLAQPGINAFLAPTRLDTATPAEPQPDPYHVDEVELGYPRYSSGELPHMSVPGRIQNADGISIGTDLTPEQQAQLRQLLWDNKEAFAFTPEQLGRSHVVEFDVQLKEGTSPIAQPYHNTPYRYRPALKAELDSMLRLGLIRPSTSEWASPVVVVPKADKSIRLTVDMREVNKRTVKQSYGMVKLNDILASLHGAKYFAICDAHKGYFQLACKSAADGGQAEDVCSFTTCFGNYSPTVMPMGCVNAPAYYQRAMDIGLSEHIGKRCFTYLDDTIIWGRTFEDLLENIRLVLQSFRKMDIKLSPAKSKFGVTKLKFLGHIVTPEGHQPDGTVLDTIQKYPVPRQKVHLQRFLGLTNWVKKYVKGYSKICAPLTDLTGNKPFVFGPEAMAAFEELKRRLVSPPILRHPDLTRPFIVTTDACQLGFGGILSQKDDEGREYVVRYGSRRTQGAERNYSATDLEAAAIVWFVTQNHVFLAGAPFTIKTDHQALSFLMTSRHLTGRLARWAIRLQEYDFTIEYKKGKLNLEADALSRSIGQDEEDDADGPPPSTEAAVADLRDTEGHHELVANLSNLILSTPTNALYPTCPPMLMADFSRRDLEHSPTPMEVSTQDEEPPSPCHSEANSEPLPPPAGIETKLAAIPRSYLCAIQGHSSTSAGRCAGGCQVCTGELLTCQIPQNLSQPYHW